MKEIIGHQLICLFVILVPCGRHGWREIDCVQFGHDYLSYMVLCGTNMIEMFTVGLDAANHWKTFGCVYQFEQPDYADEYAGDCDLKDPEELREEASRIENVGEALGVDTDSAQQSLREAADEIEKEQEQEQNWDSDDGSRGGGGMAEECSDSELDSMFGTL